MNLCALVVSLFATVVKPDEAMLRAAPAAFPFETWNELTAKYVDDKGRVDYGKLKANDDMKKLEQLFAAVAGTGPRIHPEQFKTKAAKEAYYIDAYNILVWKDVLMRFPKLSNVDKEKASFFFFTKFVVDGKEINLKDLEGEVIRPTFKDPRVHMALNCASGGCPMLPNYAFVPGKIEEQLEAEVRKFVAEPRNVSFDATTKELKLSHIFDWYKEDFGKQPAKVIGWINRYRATDAQLPPDAKIKYVDYDWTLNDVNLLKR
jgi:hypothetical protein